MKKNRLFLAIIALAIVTTTVAIVSCKKDNLNTLYQKGYTIQQATDIQQIEDPQAYMLDFKKKLSESKDNEAFELKDAAWHLACLANLDFCNINVEFDDFKFDTVEMQVNVTDGVILLGDLNTAYGQMCAKIQQFKKDPTHSDRNLYYANVSINAAGNAKIALMTSITADSKHITDHLWYFSTLGDCISMCDEYISDDSIYTWNATAKRELTRILNIYEHREYEIPIPGPGGGFQMCYFPTQNHTFDYTNTSYDPYDSPFYNDSRVFYIKNTNSNLYYEIDGLDVCYCVDSYLGLGCDYISVYRNQYPICWEVKDTTTTINNYYWNHYHRVYVEYGEPISINPPGPYD